MKKWKAEEDERFVRIVLNGLEKGEALSRSFARASKELDRTEVSLRYRWIKILSPRFHHEIEESKKGRNIQNHHRPWSSEEETQLTEIVFRHLSSGGTYTNAFKEASSLLNRSVQSVNHRWTTKMMHTHQNEIRDLNQQSLRTQRTQKKKDNEQSKARNIALQLIQQECKDLSMEELEIIHRIAYDIKNAKTETIRKMNLLFS